MSGPQPAHITGFCPMGCGETLIVAAGGCVTCSSLRCPRPDAVTAILGYRETEHIVDFSRYDFTIMHPLRERPGDALLNCALHEHVAGLSGPPVQPGRYRARGHGSSWTWEAVSRD